MRRRSTSLSGLGGCNTARHLGSILNNRWWNLGDGGVATNVLQRQLQPNVSSQLTLLLAHTCVVQVSKELAIYEFNTDSQHRG